MNIVIIDTSICNIHSLQSSLNFLGANFKVSNQIDEIKEASHIILPGVGNFDRAMSKLNDFNLVTTLNELVRSKKVPFLGICLGMQLMFESSEEGKSRGLSLIKGKIKSLKIKQKFKIPNVGFNEIYGFKKINFFKNLTSNNFYFVHSYALFKCDGLENIAFSKHAENFIAAFQHKNIYGTQFHPEKSQSCGLAMLRNFIEVN